MGRRPRVDYDSMTVTCKGEPSKDALTNYYNLLIDYQIEKYGKKVVKKALEELIAEQ